MLGRREFAFILQPSILFNVGIETHLITSMQTPHQTPSKSSYPQLYPHPHISLRLPIRSRHPSTYQLSKVRSSLLPLRPFVYSLTTQENLLTRRIGAQQEIWISAYLTNGLYKSTLHRVIHRSSNYRVSYVPFFLLNYLTGAFPVPVVGPHYTSLSYTRESSSSSSMYC